MVGLFGLMKDIDEYGMAHTVDIREIPGGRFYSVEYNRMGSRVYVQPLTEEEVMLLRRFLPELIEREEKRREEQMKGYQTQILHSW